ACPPTSAGASARKSSSASRTPCASPRTAPCPTRASSPPTSTRCGARRANVATRSLLYSRAENEALRQEMERDSRVFVMGEDVAGGAGRAAQGIVDAWGGPMGATKGLIQEFGPERVIDTPICEMSFI